MNELLVGRRVPPDPVARVAREAVAAEHWGVLALSGKAAPPAACSCSRDIKEGGLAVLAAVGVAGDKEVSKDLAVIMGKGGGEGKDAGGKEGEVVGDDRR